MTTITITMPRALDLIAALELPASLPKPEDCTTLIFDFKNSSLIEPFAMLMISSEISRYRHKHQDIEIKCSNFWHMSYAGHMGFFKSFSLDYGKSPGQANGSSRYVPLTIYSTADIEKNAASKGIEIGDEVEAISRQLSFTLCHTGLPTAW